jgi:molybdate transport system substrate-binding protein
MWFLSGFAGQVYATEATKPLHIAVASNFLATMQNLVEAYTRSSDITIRISAASSGKLYAQARHGAPYDIFFSADQDKIDKLIEAGLANDRYRITYAIGQLALWSRASQNEIAPKQILTSGAYEKLAIANPKHAPYGMASVEVLDNLSLTETQRKLIFAENINQCFQYTMTGNADLGFVALSQLKQKNRERYWLIPQALYTPIKQDAVILNKSQHTRSAIAFIQFIASPAARNIISNYGYLEPRNQGNHD